MKLFNKPNWLRPEINEPKYWLHLVILVLITYWLINQFLNPMAITVKIVAFGVLFTAIADTIAHTILGLD